MLIGCALDPDDDKPISRIVDVDLASAVILVLKDGRRINPRALACGAIVDERPGHALVASIEGSITPTDRRAAEVRQELHALGVNDLGSTEAQGQVLGFIRTVRGGTLPTDSALRAFHEAMKPVAGNHRCAAEILRALMAICGQSKDHLPSRHWMLAWYLR